MAFRGSDISEPSLDSHKAPKRSLSCKWREITRVEIACRLKIKCTFIVKQAVEWRNWKKIERVLNSLKFLDRQHAVDFISLVFRFHNEI